MASIEKLGITVLKIANIGSNTTLPVVSQQEMEMVVYQTVSQEDDIGFNFLNLLKILQWLLLAS